MKIGVMGGTFNPFHRGHYETALDVKKVAGLDRMIIMPSFISPHKSGRKEIAPPLHRYAMALLGTIEGKELEVSPLEIEEAGVSYTYKTINILNKLLAPEDSLYYVTGVESFEKIATWKRWRSLLNSVDFVVNSREGYDTSVILLSVPKEIKSKIVFNNEMKNFVRDQSDKKHIYVIETKKISISSSMIRRKLSSGESIRGLVHPFVEKYIESNKLYMKEIS